MSGVPTGKELPPRKPEAMVRFCDGMMYVSVEWGAPRGLKQSVLVDLEGLEAMVASPTAAIVAQFDPEARPVLEACLAALCRVLR